MAGVVVRGPVTIVTANTKDFLAKLKTAAAALSKLRGD